MSDKVPHSSVTSVERCGTVFRHVIPDPGSIMGAESGAGDNVEVILRQLRDSQVALDTATGIQHLGIGQPARALWWHCWRRSSQGLRLHPEPDSSYLANDDWSKMPALSRTSRCSSATGDKPVLVTHRVDVVLLHCLQVQTSLAAPIRAWTRTRRDVV